MSDSRLTTKGRVTIPRDIRDRLRIKFGGRLRFRITDSGQVVLEAIKYHVAELYGLLQRKSKKPVPVEAMDEAIRRRFKKQ